VTQLPIYLDHAATTPVDERVAAAMAECLSAAGTFGNPASSHHYGREAQARVQQARAQVARLIGARPADVIFTSGATESNNLAILGGMRGAAVGARRGHAVTARTEHRSVLDACHQLERGLRAELSAAGWTGRHRTGGGRGRAAPADAAGVHHACQQ
jgi:cysteine desulfurase